MREKVDDYLTVTQVCTQLGVPRWKVFRELQEGRVEKAKKVGWFWLIPKSEIPKLRERLAH